MVVQETSVRLAAIIRMQEVERLLDGLKEKSGFLI
jgi:hypothetical protein